MEKMSLFQFILAVIALFVLAACENSEQRRLYDEAVKMEQSPRGDYSHLTIVAYRKVVLIDASTSLGKNAQQRIDQIQANITAYLMLNEQSRARRAMEWNNWK